MKLFRQQQNNESGFTLIEVLVSTFAFTIILLGVSGIIVQMLALQRRGGGAQKVQEDSLYVLEYLAREIRVSDIVDQDNVDCTLTELVIVHPVHGTVTYQLTLGQVYREASGVNRAISSSDVSYDRLNFCVLGSTIDDQQTRVTILTQVTSRNSRPDDRVTFDLQTTVDSRNVERELTN